MRKKKLASAIGYNPGEPAPRLLASGREREAERIMALAQEAGVKITEDTALAVLLDTWGSGPRVKQGDYIPMWCWEAAAKILAFALKEG